MKLIKNYDLLREIYNAESDVNIKKIIINEYKKYLTVYFPFCLSLDFLSSSSQIEIIEKLLAQYSFYLSFDFGASKCIEKMLGEDEWKHKAINNLKKLSSELQALNISTDYDLLLKSQLYKRDYRIKLDDKKILYLEEAKYIWVPTYNYEGVIKETSIVQEHVLLSNEYVLSLGSKTKQTRTVFA